MPSRGPTAVVNRKKTLSDSEVLAYSKNRFADHSLRYKVRQLRDQEQVCHDHHQREIFRWKKFMRKSSRTSGVWSSSFDSCESEDWGLSEDSADSSAVDDQKQQNGGGGGGAGGGSPQPTPRRNNNASLELARSLTFQNEALSRLQKPWAYTFSAASHNFVYNEAEQLGRGQEKRLFLRSVSSNSTANSSCFFSSSSDRDGSKSRFSVGDMRQRSSSGPRRPLTGRSTPGVRLRSQSREKLSVSASVNKDRPKTSVGFVRARPKLKKSACVDGDGDVFSDDARVVKNNVSSVNAEQGTAASRMRDTDGKDLLEKSKGSVFFDYSQSSDELSGLSNKVLQTNNDTLPVKEKKYNAHRSNSTDAAESSKQLETDSKPGEKTFTPTENTDTHVSIVSLDNDKHKISPPGHSGALLHTPREKHTKSATGKRVKIKLATDKQSDRKTLSAHISGNSEVAESQAHNKIKTATEEQQRLSKTLSEIDSKSATMTEVNHTLQPVEERKVSGSSAILREDQSTTPLSATTTTAAAISPPSQAPTPRTHQESQNENSARPESYRYADKWRRGAEAAKKTLGLTTETVFLSRRFSAIDDRRRGSFMKIVDQLEALRQHQNSRRMNRIDDDEDVEFSGQNEVSGTPLIEAEATGMENRKEAGVIDIKDAQSQGARNGTLTSARGFRKSSKVLSSEGQQSQRKVSIPKPNKADGDSTATKTLQLIKEQQPKEKTTSIPSKTVDAQVAPKTLQEPPQEHTMLTDRDGEDVCPSDGSSSGDSDYTVFKGFKIHNYIRPQTRYRADPFLLGRRERSLLRISIENPVCLDGNRGNIPRSEMIFPRTCRKKVLEELVQRNNQPVKAQDSGVVPLELRAKIDDFYKTIEPYCPKPDLVLD
ncbi:uncharacterized protein [Littorina saxatilis]|uniref:uncharacterized protein n=1 Tax=Littorina saxatilis TaxID=31220 RepID=UPI0038B68B33